MKLTLKKTWTECLRMWKWIAEQVEAGSKKTGKKLKDEWMEKNNYSGIVMCNCFFCEYTARHKHGCESCPGHLVDKTFNCNNNSYNFYWKPIAFYKELTKLHNLFLLELKREKAKK